MKFNLFGFEFFGEDMVGGFWFCSFKDYGDFHRSLVGWYYDQGTIYLDIFFINLVIG